MKTEKMLIFFASKGFGVKSEVKFRGDTFTLATAALIKPNGKKQKVILQGEGIARKSCTQEWDLDIGTNVATNRAVEALLKKYRRKSRAVHSWCEG